MTAHIVSFVSVLGNIDSTNAFTIHITTYLLEKPYATAQFITEQVSN